MQTDWRRQLVCAALLRSWHSWKLMRELYSSHSRDCCLSETRSKNQDAAWQQAESGVFDIIAQTGNTTTHQCAGGHVPTQRMKGTRMPFPLRIAVVGSVRRQMFDEQSPPGHLCARPGTTPKPQQRPSLIDKSQVATNTSESGSKTQRSNPPTLSCTRLQASARSINTRRVPSP